jgi:hypothetical protein
LLVEKTILKCILKKYILRVKGKGKAIPGQTLGAPGGFRLPELKSIGT